MIFLTWLRSRRVADSAAKSIRTMPVKPLLGPLIGFSGTQVAPPLLDPQAEQTPHHVPIDLVELGGGIAGAKVVAPATQDRIQIRDHVADIASDPGASGALAHLGPHPGHGRLAGPAVQVVAHDAPLFPQPPRHAR